MQPADFRHYISPSAFRTDFRPEDGDLDEVGVMSTRTVATVAHQGEARDVGSIRIHAGAGTTIMQLNDGRPNDLGEQQLFEVEMMTDQEVAAYVQGKIGRVALRLHPVAKIVTLAPAPALV
jgi:hypothetical protein